MQKIRIILLFLVFSSAVFAQNAVKADALFQDGDYSAAKVEYQRLLKRYPTSALYNYRYARCTQELGDYQTALDYFEKSGSRYDLKHFYVGEICMRLFYFDRAIDSYEKYLATLESSSHRIPYIKSQLLQAEKMKRYMRRVEKVEIVDSVETTVDSILYYCTLSPEAGTMQCNLQNDIVYTNQREDRRLWATKRNDSTTVIVSSHSLMDQWTTPDTLPQNVNMSAQQAYPYMLSDGVTLYFSSCDTSGLGGYDIYVTRYNTHTEVYTAPENLGMPFNSTGNDYLMLIDENKNIGYFATDRFTKKGRVSIYTFIPTKQKTYWRGVSQDSLAAYAQLHYTIAAQMPLEQEEETNIQPIITQKEEKTANDIFFVLNDSVVYTSLAEFHNPTARKNYQEWTNLRKQVEYDTQHLANLRQQYSEAEETERKKMAPVILRLEDKLSQSIEQCDKLIHTIRQLEFNHLQQ